MKEAIGGSWLYTLVIVFIALFTTFVSVTTNYTRTYKVKDQLISIIEDNNGVNKNTLEQISSYLSSIGYGATGNCPNDDGENWVPFSNDNTNGAVGYGGKINYCIYRHVVTCRTVSNTKGTAGKKSVAGKLRGQGYNSIPRAYYGVAAFFRIDWPILNYIINLKVTGETAVLHMVNAESDIYEMGSNTC